MQKPGKVDSIGSKRVAGFHFTNVRQCLCLLLACAISARITASCVNSRHTLVILLDGLCEVGGNDNVIVGMTNNQKDVDFVAAVRFWQGWCGLRISLLSQETN